MVEGRNTGLMRCVETNGTGPARTPMVMNPVVDLGVLFSITITITISAAAAVCVII